MVNIVEPERLDASKLFRRLHDVCAQAVPLEPLWGFFLYKKAITSIVADPGSGKTTLCYCLATELSKGRPFLTISPEEPVKVLYMDFESSDSLINARINLIGKDNEEFPDFWTYNIVDYYFPQIALCAKEFCIQQGINLVIIDNQTTAFNTRDENDNSEAARQMKSLREWVSDTNVSCIQIHHTSKANLAGTRKGSGAFARARLADIMLNLEIPDENEPDIVKLETVKNRMVNDKVLWYLKKQEGNFTFTEQPLCAKGTQTNTKIYQVQKLLLTFMQTGEEYPLDTIIKYGITIDGYKEFDIKNALSKLHQQGLLSKPRYGYWSKRNVVRANTY